jgi:VanZ family protein
LKITKSLGKRAFSDNLLEDRYWTSASMLQLSNESGIDRKQSTFFLAFLYLSCALLVIAYANMYSVYRYISHALGDRFITLTPVILPILLLLWFLTAASRRTSRGKLFIEWRWLLPGLAFCIFALFIPDPRFGVKRIHVSEYLLLSLLVRYTMSHRLSGLPLLFFSCLFTAILGVHDEFLQGIHPNRTYGLRDMLVNGISGAGGAFIWHGLHLFTRNCRVGSDVQSGTILHHLYLSWLVISVLAFIVPLTGYLYNFMPLWLILPLAASTVFWSCFLLTDNSHLRHGVSVLSYASFILLIYPAAVNGLQIPFH